MHNMVESAQLRAEKAGDELLAEMRAKGAQSVNDVFEKHAEDVLRQWQALSMDMVFHYTDNTDISTMTALSYPDEWLRGVGYADGPPAPPVQDQCPPKCENTPVVV